MGAFLALGRAWPEHLPPRPLALLVPLLAVLGGGFALERAPDAGHARDLGALRADPFLLADPREDQQVLHLVAWPLALAVGDEAAIRTVALASLGLTVILASVAARALGLGPPAALLAQALLLVLPVTSARLLLGLVPSLFGQAAEALLVAHLARRLAFLNGARDAAATCIFFFIAQCAYTGSLLEVGVLGLLLGGWEIGTGDWRRGWRLLGGYGIAAALVLAARVVLFLPGPGLDMAPTAREASAQGEGALGLLLLHGPLLPASLLLGLAALRHAPVHPRRVLLAALAGGMVALLLRRVVPFLGGTTGDLPFPALPVAVISAAVLAWMAGRGRSGRAAALLLAAAALGWGMVRALALGAPGASALG